MNLRNRQCCIFSFQVVLPGETHKSRWMASASQGKHSGQSHCKEAGRADAFRVACASKCLGIGAWIAHIGLERSCYDFAVNLTDTTPYAQAVQRQIQRSMTGEERLLLALEMSVFVRELSAARIRREHPEWSDVEITREVLRRIPTQRR